LTKRTRKSTSKQSCSAPASLGRVLAGALIAVAAFIFSQCSPDAATTNPPATTASVTRQATTRPPTTAAPTTRPATTVAPPTNPPAANVTPISVGQGFGARKGFWQVYFTAPTGSRDASTYRGGIDEVLAADIGRVQRTLDIAAYEFNSPALTQAVIAARGRGVRVRMVTDNEAGREDEDSTVPQLEAAGVNVVDDARSALMHNKFMILDSTTVWMGSMNYTINDTYRNNNHMVSLRSRQAVQNYQAEFDEMFVQGQFGPRSPSQTPNPFFTLDGIAVATFYAPEDEVIAAIDTTLSGAQRSIRFMTFSFTVDEMGDIIQQRAQAGVQVQGIFERTGSETQFSELTRLFCAGLNVRQDGNPFVLHHKVFIVDDEIVISGSFNISENATNSNDENLIIVTDRDLAAQFTAEFNRRWAEAARPASLACP
jgi:phosphatidylserine/phosphatidylglycerophosphate/cardiolipin synthase-like enzyme